MIFEELVLHNFGVYQGEQRLQLAPPDRERPIVLVGGLNGAGKTSLLDAIHLALYGQMASVSGRRGLAYDKYLRGLISRGADPAQGACVELAFQVQAAGGLHRYRVRRTWSVSDSGYTREILDVFHNDRHARELSERWSEQVESFVPRGVAPLFFFDAEQIEGFISPDTNRELLRTSLRSLLGLDVVERLTDDLAIMRRKKYLRSADDGSRAILQQLEREVVSARDAETRAKADFEAARTVVISAQEGLETVTAEFRLRGGQLFEQKSALEAQQTLFKDRIDRAQSELREIAEGPACFLLLANRLAEVGAQAREEERVLRERHWVEALRERDAELLQGLRESLESEHLVRVEEAFSRDVERRAARSLKEPILGLSEAGCATVAEQTNGVLDDQVRLLRPRLSELEGAELELLSVERQLQGIPPEERIAALQSQRIEALATSERAMAICVAAEQRVAEAARLVEEQERKRRKALEEAASRELDGEDAARLQRHSERVMRTLGEFQRQLTRRHISRIEQAILESLRELLHKQRLIRSLAIDPDTFDVTLTGDQERLLRADQLSAGERQLLAVATLWGLARSSGRALPVVIDTPLGRLDATHRSRLITRYFPHASHQVILLSTDDEIDAAAAKQLRPYIGRTYELRFEEELSATRVQEGYFC